MEKNIIKLFDDNIKNLTFTPKGVKVGIGLYKKLSEIGRIKNEKGLFFGVIDVGLEMPFLDKKTHVIVDPTLDDWDFEMPRKG